MNEILSVTLKALSVMATGCLYFWAGIPAGLAFRFSVPVSALLTAVGACAGVIGLALAGAPIQRWFMRKYEKQFAKFQKSRLIKLWEKFGVVGFCLLSPGITGAPQAALIALILGARLRRIILWTCAGVLMFTLLLMLVYLVGVEQIPLLRKWIYPQTP